MNWRVFIPPAKLNAMSEQLGSALPAGTLRRLVSVPSIDIIGRCIEPSIAKPKTKHSVAAAAFLMLYVAIYLSIGFLGISLIGRAWATIFE